MNQSAPLRPPAAAPLTAEAMAVLAHGFALAPDLGAVADLLARSAVRYLGGWAAVALAPPGEVLPAALRILATAGLPLSLNDLPLSLLAGPAARAWRRQEPVRTAAVHQAPAEPAGRQAPAGIWRLAMLTLPGSDGPVGLLLHATPAPLATAQLLTAQGGLAAASRLAAETCRQLAAAAAHEVRNALTEARGLAQLASSTGPAAGTGPAASTGPAAGTGPAAAPRLQAAVAAIDRAAARAHDLLTLSRPLWLHPVPLSLAALADAVLPVCGLPDTVTVRRRYHPGGPPVQADPERLRQVVYNLVTNAIRAMGGRGTVTLTTGVAGGTAWLAVADSGPCVPLQHQPRLFTPYFTTRDDGSGLGLAVSRRLTEAQGGSLSLQSTSDGGATFILRLPRGQD